MRARHDDLVVDRDTALVGEATATFSRCRNWRYQLTRQWDPERPWTVFVMLNPSTADAFQLDPTVRRCIGFARGWGAGGLVVLNLFALRSTKPVELYRHDDPVGPANDHAIATLPPWQDVEQVVCAWGVHGRHQGRGRQVADLLASLPELPRRPVCLGVTQGGQPRHPLYVPGDASVSLFDGGTHR